MTKYFCDKCGKEIGTHFFKIIEKSANFFEKVICWECEKEYKKILDKFDIEKQRINAINEFFDVDKEAK